MSIDAVSNTNLSDVLAVLLILKVLLQSLLLDYVVDAVAQQAMAAFQIFTLNATNAFKLFDLSPGAQNGTPLDEVGLYALLMVNITFTMMAGNNQWNHQFWL